MILGMSLRGWDQTPEILWMSMQDLRHYLDDWYIIMLMEFLHSRYAVDEEGHEDLIYQIANQSV